MSKEFFDAYRARRNKATAKIQDSEHAALLISDLKNVRYLTGFSGSNALLVIREDGQHLLLTDGRYDTQIRVETGEPEDISIEIGGKLFDRAAEFAGKDFAVEPSLDYGQARALDNPPVLSSVVEDLRLVKDELEIEALAAAGELADSVWRSFIEDDGIREGITEIQAAAELEFQLRTAGADGLSFDTILASGLNATKPHAGVSRERIVPGLVTVDFGVYLDGYASDQTRTVCVGEPDELARELYDVVYRAQKAGEAILAPGVALRNVDAACRDVITDAGYGEFFVHSTGHGVGLDVHEAPRAAAGVNPEDELVEGMTVTVEPGIYIPGKTGLRIENTYVITNDGARSFNVSPTELIVV
ncbi:aminopeptidase P family protein [Corynebacterium sp. c24Ua_83]|uniref:M24 family metallopeptidase n=1 Tax=Corynebacterium sp. c24Ua_83 TaxID=3032350 RepID=UPI0032654551